MLTSNSNHVRSIADLAAHLTDSALEAVAGVGIYGDSVALELGLWHALTAELEQELRAA